MISAFGEDQPGIVRRFSQYLASKDVNIVDLYGDRNGTQFVLIGQVEVPARWDVPMMQADLEQMGQELGFTVKLQHENVFVATNQLRLTRAIESPANRQSVAGRIPSSETPASHRQAKELLHMLRTDEILSTIQMLHAEHLDVRSVTLGLNLDDCAAPSLDHLCRKVRQKITSRASRLVEACDRVGAKYGIPIINKRVAISPAATLLAGHGHGSAVQLAKTLDAAAADCRIDFVGGFTALVHKGISPGDRVVMESLPEVLSQTQRVCASVNVASRRAGINMDAVQRMGHLLLEIAAATAAQRGFGCAKLVIFANIPEDNPFMAGAYPGAGEPEAVINIGVSGPGVVCSALRRRLAHGDDLTLGDLAEEIKITSFRVTRVGELIGREVASELGVEFGIVDLSLAPTPTVGDSVGEILKTLGIAAIGAPGSTAAVAMLNDAVKKGGLFASSSVGGLERRVYPRERRRGAGRCRGPRRPGAGKTRSNDQRLLRGTRHAGHPRRHARRNDRGDHRRRDGHRRNQRQNNGRAAHSGPGGEGRRNGRLRRTLRVESGDGSPQQRGQRRVRPLWRPHPRPHAIAAELVYFSC